MRPVVLLLAFSLFVPAGTVEGGRGNAAYDAQRWDDALAAYTAGLERAPADTRAALLNNTGLVRTAQGQWVDAVEAFRRSYEAAVTPADLARAAFHAGLAATHAAQPDAALQWLRIALLADPTAEDARVAYEVVRRQRDAPPRDDDTPDAPRPTPSRLAQQLKARADSLAAARQYGAALALLEEAQRQDTSVAAYTDYMERLRLIAALEAME